MCSSRSSAPKPICRICPFAARNARARFIFANNAVKAVFGWRPEELIGKNVRMFGFVNLYGCEVGDDTRIGFEHACVGQIHHQLVQCAVGLEPSVRGVDQHVPVGFILQPVDVHVLQLAVMVFANVTVSRFRIVAIEFSTLPEFQTSASPVEKYGWPTWFPPLPYEQSSARAFGSMRIFSLTTRATTSTTATLRKAGIK